MKVLQIGGSNWADSYPIYREEVSWNYCPEKQVISYVDKYIADTLAKKGRLEAYDCILIMGANLSLNALDKLAQIVDSYRVIYDSRLQVSEEVQAFLGFKSAWKLDCANPVDIIRQITFYFYPKQSGFRLLPVNASLSPNYLGAINYQGSNHLKLEVDYSDDYQPLLSWNYDVYLDPFRDIECWLEFTKGIDCDLQLVLEEVGTAASYQGGKRYVISNEQLDTPLIIQGSTQRSYLMATLYAKGKGKVDIGALHLRWSRGPFGKFIVGGQRSSDEKREEFFHYFDPGNLKPPLCVYFSGYHSLESFEGYYMMRSFHHPFLLIADQRLEGGAFYIGSAEYEQKLKDVIIDALQKLHFTNEQLILSGMSMGTFGALYYGAQLNPHAIILNKPLVNLGNIAANLQKDRPFEFGTSLDLLLTNTKRNDQVGVEQLNKYFWTNFEKGNFDKTTFAIAYMENDDYDGQAFSELVQFLAQSKSKAKIISQGFLGRHNDDFIENTKWFKNQFKRIISEDFRRESE